MTAPLVRPFAGLRPAPGRAADVIAPPYDVIDVNEARALAEGRPWSFLRVSRAEIDLPPDTDPYSDAVYAKARENLDRMTDEGVLVRDPAPCYTVYRITAGDHVQTGLVVGALVSEYDGNRVRKHELTRPAKEDDRVRQIEAVNAQTGPVLLVHKPDAALDAVCAAATASPPDADVAAEGGVRHQTWTVTEPGAIQKITDAFAAMDAVYIADGHHRSAAASRVAANRRRAGASSPDASHQAFLAVSFPVDQMRILDYNRVVRDLNGHAAEAFVDLVRPRFLVTAHDGPARPPERHKFGMFLDGKWYLLDLKDKPSADAHPVERLDVSLLADAVLSTTLGVGNPRLDPRIDFVGGARGLEALEARVKSGEWAVAFAMHPTSLDDLMAVADAGEEMPPKSTWFEPKLADGLVSLVLD